MVANMNVIIDLHDVLLSVHRWEPCIMKSHKIGFYFKVAKPLQSFWLHLHLKTPEPSDDSGDVQDIIKATPNYKEITAPKLKFEGKPGRDQFALALFEGVGIDDLISDSLFNTNDLSDVLEEACTIPFAKKLLYPLLYINGLSNLIDILPNW